jgi:hypothetical protein
VAGKGALPAKSRGSFQIWKPAKRQRWICYNLDLTLNTVHAFINSVKASVALALHPIEGPRYNLSTAVRFQLLKTI